MRYFSCCVLALLLGAARLDAQQSDPGLDSLIARVGRGDASARTALERIGRGLATDAAQHRLDAGVARQTARAAITLAEPLTSLDQRATPREFTWRPIAVRALRQAVSDDSGDVWSMTQLERIAPYPHLWWDPEKELAHFRALAKWVHPLPVGLLRVRAELELEIGSVDSAAAVLDAIPPGALSRAVTGSLQAAIAFARGEAAAGREAYFAGAEAIAGPADAERYGRELVFIAKPEDVKAWNELSFAPGVREEWLKAFWTRLDLRDAQLPGTRLPEQFRRWQLALRQYRWESDGSTAMAIDVPRGAANELNLDDVSFPRDASSISQDNRYMPQSRILDDRGLLVLRLGIPDREANLSGITATSEQNLLWTTPEGPLIVGFSRPARDGVTLYRFGMLARNRPVGDLMTVCQLDSRLCVVAAQVFSARMGGSRGILPPGSSRARTLRLDYTRMRDIAEHTESNRETYSDSLGAIVQAYGIPNGGALVVLAVPVKHLVLNDKKREAQRSFAVRVRVVIGDSAAGRIIATLDTIRTWQTTAPVGKDAYLSTYLTVPTPPGNWTVNVVVGDSLRLAGTGTRFPRLPMAPFDGKALRLGDPILGLEGTGLAWRRSGDVVPLNPLGAWQVKDVGILNYELDGLMVGREYQTRFEFWKADPKTKAASNVITFTTSATATHQAVRRELSFRELSPGDYRLVIRVHDPVTNEDAVRARRIAVRK